MRLLPLAEGDPETGAGHERATQQIRDHSRFRLSVPGSNSTYLSTDQADFTDFICRGRVQSAVAY